MLVAYDDQRVIGHQGSIPWHVKEDMILFRKRTMGNVVVMGRKTWESLPKKPLLGRVNIILSSNYVSIPSDARNDTQIFVTQDLQDALAFSRRVHPHKEIFIVGGLQVYESTFGIADQIIVSKIDGEHPGDVYFPDIPDGWHLRSFDKRDGFTVLTYRK